jgi:hypothetical protein
VPAAVAADRVFQVAITSALKAKVDGLTPHSGFEQETTKMPLSPMRRLSASAPQNGQGRSLGSSLI